MDRKWILPAGAPEAADALAGGLRISRAAALMLINRGHGEPESARGFLEPSLLALRDPRHDGEITAAAGFLRDAVRKGRRITVFGDYDADGICATALLVGCLAAIGADVDFHIPHRVTDGYGLSCKALEKLKGKGTEVAITVDCGIAAHREAEHARSLGIDLIVTDHHKPKATRPPALHVINPQLPGADFGFKYLAGVGVAFKLVWALGQALGSGAHVPDDYRPLLVDGLSLVALGTIADMVPLVDENRVLAFYGLKALPQSSNVGLRALIEVAGIGEGAVSSHDVGFQLAPRLNAVGRMGEATKAVQMLLTNDALLAAELAAHHERQNRLRQNVQKAILEEAQGLVEQQMSLQGPGCIVLCSPDWHQGVVGLVAARLTEQFWRPAFVFRQENGYARGSARSIPGFPLFDAIARCEELVDQFGGHEAAAGLTIRTENLGAFARRMNEIAVEVLGPGAPRPELALEGEVALEELTPAVVAELYRLSPFGKENPHPLFMARELRLVGRPLLVGSTRKHLSFLVRQRDTSLRAIAFDKAAWLDYLVAHADEPLALAFEPTISRFAGADRVELRALDAACAPDLDIAVR